MSHLENASQVILRQQQLLSPRTLFVGPLGDGLLRGEIRERLDSPVKGLVWDYAKYLAHQNDGELLFSLYPDPSWQFDQIVLFMPKSKEVVDLVLSSLADRITATTKLWLIGGKREGVESKAKRMLKDGWDGQKVDSARHCQLWELYPRMQELPNLASCWKKMTVEFPGQSIQSMRFLPGVFSAGRLDEGTRLLLENLPEFREIQNASSPRILDFGCGSGVVGLYLKKRFPQANVEMVDISLPALVSARANAEKLGVEADIYPSNGLDDVKPGLSAIITNPPFHQGVKQDTQVTYRFLQSCSRHLSRGGSLVLVANSFLPYAEWIEKAVGPFKIISDNNKFRVYHAIKI